MQPPVLVQVISQPLVAHEVAVGAKVQLSAASGDLFGCPACSGLPESFVGPPSAVAKLEEEKV